MKKILLLVLSYVFAVSGCVTAPSFHEADSSSPHAVLKFQSYMGIGNALTVIEINGHVPDSLKWNYHHFQVSPGHVSVLVESCQSLRNGYIGSAIVDIDVEANRTYSFTRDIQKDGIVLTVTRDDGYVFYHANMSLDPGYCPG